MSLDRKTDVMVEYAKQRHIPIVVHESKTTLVGYIDIPCNLHEDKANVPTTTPSCVIRRFVKPVQFYKAW